MKTENINMQAVGLGNTSISTDLAQNVPECRNTYIINIFVQILQLVFVSHNTSMDMCHPGPLILCI